MVVGPMPSFSKIALMCFSTAASLTTRVSAIPRFDLPSGADALDRFHERGHVADALLQQTPDPFGALADQVERVR